MRSEALTMTKVAILALALLALPLVSVAQSERHPYTLPHVLRFASGEDLVGLNPHFNQQGVVGYLAHMTMAYLVRYDARNRPIPELAATIPTQANGGISRDGKTITYRLRHDAKWSDGAAFTSADVAFSIAVVQNPKNDEAGGDDFHRIVRVDTPDRYTVVLHLKAPYSDFLATYFGTGGANPCVLPKHLLGDLPELNDAPYNSLPVGIGPFKYASWKRGESVELVPDPLYFRGRPKLERVIFKIIPDRNTMLTQLTTHEIDLWIPAAASYVPRLRSIPGITVGILPSYFYNHVDFNTARGALRDPIVRRALRMATDRATILAKINHGIGSLQEGLLAPAHPYYDPHIALVPYDLARANGLLDHAGYVRGPDGIRAKHGQRLAFNYGTSLGSPDTDAMIELIRASWKQLGVDLTVRRYLSATFFGPYSAGGILYAGKFDVVNFAWGVGPLGDQQNIFSCRRIPPNGQNVTRYCNAEVDRAMVDFNATYDEARQRRDAWLIQERIVRDAPTIVMSARADVIAYNSDLRNFHPNQVSPFDDVLNVDI
jgi:peptide/nickel transport system substrate-binding protein